GGAEASSRAIAAAARGGLGPIVESRSESAIALDRRHDDGASDPPRGAGVGADDRRGGGAGATRELASGGVGLPAGGGGVEGGGSPHPPGPAVRRGGCAAVAGARRAESGIGPGTARRPRTAASRCGSEPMSGGEHHRRWRTADGPGGTSPGPWH